MELPYGDIGTSVYAFRERLAHGISDREEILGILSAVNGTVQPEGVGHASSIGFKRLG